MNRGTTFATGVGVGMGVMYLLDPELGNRRRKRMRDQTVHASRVSGRRLGKARRDLAHRAQGVVAEATAAVREQQVDDDVLIERVRARLGRLVSHPRAVHVEACDGCVTLSGPVLSPELNRLLAGVHAVRGVTGVQNALEVHADPENVPALQGGLSRRGRGAPLLGHVPPGARLVFGIAGGLLMAAGVQRRNAATLPVAALAAAMLGRAMTADPRRLTRGRHVVTKTIHIGAPVHEVFGFWSRWENFPRFMSNLIEVHDLGNGRSHWVARGPGGVPVGWDAEVTRFEPGRRIAWRSARGSRVPNSGSVHFMPEAGGTRVHIQLHYRPPAGMLGHALAKLFGADPRSEMDEDLLRLKRMIEDGRTRVPGETERREELAGDRPTASTANSPHQMNRTAGTRPAPTTLNSPPASVRS